MAAGKIDSKNDSIEGTPELEEIREPDSAFNPGKDEVAAAGDENVDAGEVDKELGELKDAGVDENAEKMAENEDQVEDEAAAPEKEVPNQEEGGEKTGGEAPEAEGQALRTLGNTKKRTEGNGTQDPQKRKRQRRRQYDDAPKEEPESDEEETPMAGENDVDDDDDDDDDDNLGGVDESNIILGGRRTRGKKIDYKKANEELPADDDDEDGEFEDKGEEEE